MKETEIIEIYYRPGWPLCFLPIAGAAYLALAYFKLIHTQVQLPDIWTAIFISMCLFFAVVLIYSRSKLYFDNSARACIQESQNFYGTKKKMYYYDDIVNIVVQLHKRRERGGYYVSLSQGLSIFSLTGTKYIELRYLGREKQFYVEAVKFAHRICQHTGLAFLDTTVEANSD